MRPSASGSGTLSQGKSERTVLANPVDARPCTKRRCSVVLAAIGDQKRPTCLAELCQCAQCLPIGEAWDAEQIEQVDLVEFLVVICDGKNAHSFQGEMLMSSSDFGAV